MPGIQCFAWNGNGSRIALCPTNNEIWIFDSANSPDITKWKQIACLKEHFNIISALDWHPQTNLLLSCSVDRGTIVWEQNAEGKFLPQMGVNQEKMANLDGVWNTKGDKYVVAASSGNVYVGRYYADNNFWVAHGVTKKPLHKASVVSVRFDPQSGRVVASASLDGSVCITSAYHEDLDKDSTAGPFGNVSSFGESLLSISSPTWINGLCFSHNSNVLAYVS